MEQNQKSLQETFAPEGICYGCGPSNLNGLHIQSYPKDDEVVAHWTPQAHHEAFSGILNGGIIGTILDCHCNWTAAYTLMKNEQAIAPPCTVTAEYSVQLLKPTPSHTELRLVAKPIEIEGNKVWVEGCIQVNNENTATFKGLFVAVPPEHPANPKA